MTGKALRFLHIGCLQLGRSLTGLTEVPDHLSSAICGASANAAKAAFDVAVAQHVDFVVISGDLFDKANLSPRAVRLVLEQFERLGKRKIPVYWGGESAEGNWPVGLPLPDNVIRFSLSKTSTEIHRIDDTPAVAIVAGGTPADRVRAGDFQPTQSAPHTIAIAVGEAKAGDLTAGAINYWALGGRDGNTTLCDEPCTAHDPGNVQALSPEGEGSHGVTVVELTEHSPPRLTHHTTDSIRWVNQRLTIAAGEDLIGLQETLAARATDLAADHPERHVFVRWHLKCDETLSSQLRQNSTAGNVVAKLREQYGKAKHAVWTVGLEAEPSEKLPSEWYEEDTILGDFLRSLKEHQSKGKPLALDTMAPSTSSSQQLNRLVRLDDAERKTLLRRVATMGVDLLSGPSAADDTNEVEIKFKGGKQNAGTGKMKIKHDGDSWSSDQNQAAMMEMLDEQEVSK